MPSSHRTHSVVAGVACGAGAALFWAAGFVGVLHGLHVGLSPADLAVHRFTWSGLAFLPLMLRGGLADLNGVGWGRGLVLALLGGPAFALLSYSGFLLVPLGHGGVIQPSCAALGGLLLARIVLGEPLSPRRAAGALIIIAGLFAIGVEGFTAMGARGVAGDLVFVTTGLLFASFGTMLRHWRIGALSATMAVSVLALLAVPLYAAAGGFASMLVAGWRENLLQAVLQGALAGPGAIFLFVRSVQFLGAGRAAVFPSLVPPFVLLIGWLALGEVPTPLQLTGLAIVLLGFRLAQSMR